MGKRLLEELPFKNVHGIRMVDFSFMESSKAKYKKKK